MIPLRDDNPTRTAPVVTVALIAANTLVFIYQWALGPGGETLVQRFGAIPVDLLGGADGRPAGGIPVWTTIFTSMFLHGGLFHLAGNMLYLWIFGNNIEDVLGHARYLGFYLACGVVAVYGHALTDPSGTMPMIGASGAISGVLGAYIVLFPHARVLTLVPLGFFVQWIWIPAGFVLGIWIVVQAANGLFNLGAPGGVAWFAHIGGFLSGAILILIVRWRRGRPWRAIGFV